MAKFNNTSIAILSLLLVRRRRQQRLTRKKKWWIHPIIRERSRTGKLAILHEKLKQHPDKFFDYYRMSINSFHYLLSVISDKIQGTDTFMRNCIGVEEKLSVTLR